MPYAEGERDMVMLQHKFVVEWADGREVSRWVSSSLPLFAVLSPYSFIFHFSPVLSSRAQLNCFMHLYICLR